MSDLTKAPEQILVDLINTDNGSSLTPGLISFGLPTAATGDNPTRNTELTVSATQGSGYRGSVVVRYNRVNLADVPQGADIVFTLGDAARLADLVDEINARYSINLTPADYVDADLPTFTGEANETHDIALVAGSDSLIFIGQLTITIKGEDIELGSVITTNELSGLTPPDQAPAATA